MGSNFLLGYPGNVEYFNIQCNKYCEHTERTGNIYFVHYTDHSAWSLVPKYQTSKSEQETPYEPNVTNKFLSVKIL